MELARASRVADYEAGLLHDEHFHSHCQKCDDLGHTYDEDIGVDLCAWCKHLRIYHLFKCVLSDEQASIVGVLVNPLRDESKNCDFCRFIVDCDSEWFLKLDLLSVIVKEKGLLLTPRQFSINDWVSQSKHDVYATSEKEGSHVQWINWPFVRAQLRSMLGSGTQPPLDAAIETQLQDVRVIDVQHRSVIDLPAGAPFVALSYVWGDCREDFQLTTSNLAELKRHRSITMAGLPRTIEDSIQVCNRLGERYLWVDRLCIIQDDVPHHKATQLEQMMTIYRQARFTIVALAGEDASYGLPGVSTPRSNGQRILPFK